MLDDDLDVGDRLLIGLPVRGATCQFRHFGDKRLVVFAPIENDFLLRHRRLLPNHILR